MPSLFSRLKGRDGKGKKKNGLDDLANQQPQKPRWDDAWTRKTIEPEEVHELIRFCTQELKARGMTSNLGPAARAHHMNGRSLARILCHSRKLTVPCSSRSPIPPAPVPPDFRSERRPYFYTTLF